MQTRVRSKTKRLRLEIILITFGILASVAGLSYLSNRPGILISEIIVEGNNYLSADAVRAQVAQSIDGKVLALFPKNNVLLLGPSNLEKILENKYPSIRNVEVAILSLNSVKVKVEERVPVYEYCTDVCFLADKDTYLFRLSSDLGLDDLINIVLEDASILALNPISTLILESDRASNITQILAGIKQIGIVADTITIMPALDVRIHSKEGWYLLYNQETDVEKVMRNLRVALESSNIPENEKLSYIDLRFGNKVFYK